MVKTDGELVAEIGTTAKSDKELAVEILCAYLRGGFHPPKPKSEEETAIGTFLRTVYAELRALPDD